LLLLAYDILQFCPLVLQSDHTTYTLFPFAAIEGFFDNGPAVLLTSIGALNVAPASILAEKNISGSRDDGDVVKSCHTTYTLFPQPYEGNTKKER
jgi:hypothetical protein